MKNKYTKEQILGFNENDWSFRRSSGYAGYDPIKNPYTKDAYPDESKWIYEDDYRERKRLKAKYEEEYRLLADFRNECLEFGKYPEYVIQEFLNKKYFNG